MRSTRGLRAAVAAGAVALVVTLVVAIGGLTANGLQAVANGRGTDARSRSDAVTPFAANTSARHDVAVVARPQVKPSKHHNAPAIGVLATAALVLAGWGWVRLRSRAEGFGRRSRRQFRPRGPPLLLPA